MAITKKIEPFRLQYSDTPAKPKQPVVRVKPSYYQFLEQCIDYTIENMEKGE